MRYALSEEQQQLRAFLAERSPPAEVRRAMETQRGCELALWKQMVAELGLPGVRVRETLGGSGPGFAELGLVMAERGRSLACAPHFSSAVQAAGALRHAAPPGARDSGLAAIAAGETTALALWEPGSGWELAEIRASARPEGRGFCIRGAKQHVIDRQSAARPLVVARLPGTSGGGGTAAVRGGPERNRRDAAQPGDARSHAAAIKHRCADVLIALEGARTLARGAAGAVDALSDEIPLLAAAAKARAADAFIAGAWSNIQIHGRHRLHLGARRAPPLPARPGLGHPARPLALAAGAHRAAAQRLTSAPRRRRRADCARPGTCAPIRRNRSRSSASTL